MIPVNEPRLDGNELKYLTECIETGWISSEGPFVSAFERAISKVTDRRHGIAVSNGTAAIDAAVEALGIGPGDEVIVPTFTIISCVMQIVRAGAVPVFVDCDPTTFNVRPEDVIARITDRTKAIMIVHIYGLPVDMDPILEAANERGILVIEDAAEAIGQTYKGRPCGSFGDISCLSFYPNKHVTTGEGGMVLTNSDTLAETVKSLRNLCFLPERRFVHERLGWNLRMTNMQAAIGLAQTERLPEFIKRKREIGALYTELFKGLPGVQLPVTRLDHADNLYWVYTLVLDEDHPLDAEAAMAKLRGAGIGTRPFFYPLHAQPVLQSTIKPERFEAAERIYRRGFYIPSGLGLSNAQMRSVAEAVWNILS